jgi:hypothetical protein
MVFLCHCIWQDIEDLGYLDSSELVEIGMAPSHIRELKKKGAYQLTI